MAEEQVKNKKLVIINRILRWFGLGLLALLIILGLIFQAPWKVIVLLLVILAACTQLPRPARKWFWLSAAAIVFALIIWVFLPDNNEGWRPYTFDKELAALQAKYAIPDSENAAIIYNRLLKDHGPNEFWPDFLDYESLYLTRRMPWSCNEYPELAKWIDGHKSVIADLIEIGKKEKCYFPRKSNYGDLESPARRLNTTRRWAFLLSQAANNDFAEGRTDYALERYMTILKMAGHGCQQPTIGDMLVGIAIEALALRGFKMFVVMGDATDKRLGTIEQAIADIKHDWNYDWPKLLEDEKLMAKNRFGEYYEIDSKGRIRLSRDPKARIRKLLRDILGESFKDEYMKYNPKLWVNPNFWQRKLIKAKAIIYWFYLPSKPQKGAKVIDKIYEKHYMMADADFDWIKEPEEISPGFMFNFSCLIEHLVYSTTVSYYRIHDIYLRCTADNNVSCLILVLRRYKNKHGRWPQTLDGIKNIVPNEIFVDPINGGSFVYKLTEENFTLYSKGKNNIDEGGERSRESGGDDWLFWPPKIRKTTKEEKANDEQ